MTEITPPELQKRSSGKAKASPMITPLRSKVKKLEEEIDLLRLELNGENAKNTYIQLKFNEETRLFIKISLLAQERKTLTETAEICRAWYEGKIDEAWAKIKIIADIGKETNWKTRQEDINQVFKKLKGEKL